jgi:hypothetical protein
MRKAGVIVLLFCMLALAATVPASQRRRGKPKPKPATVCGDPTATCRTSVEFQPYQLPFLLASNAVIYDTEQFYAVILKSVRDESNGNDCNVFIPEAERIEAQTLFPHNKVFASRCFDPGDMYYTGVGPNQQFIGVYAGRTKAEAAKVLAQVKASGKFPGANLRRMRAGFNGT